MRLVYANDVGLHHRKSLQYLLEQFISALLGFRNQMLVLIDLPEILLNLTDIFHYPQVIFRHPPMVLPHLPLGFIHTLLCPRHFLR